MSDDEGDHEESPDELPPLQDGEAGDKGGGESPSENMENKISFASHQFFVFVSCYMGYMLFLYNRKSFTFILPHVIMEEYYSSYEVSSILTAQTLSYTLSKFLAGIMCDWYSPKMIFSIGMFGTGFFMVGFTDNYDIVNLMLLSFFNGIAQGFSWPPAAKIVRAWYPSTQFGFWWALLSTSANVSGAIGPSIASLMCNANGWRTAIQIPALAAVICSFVVYFLLVDNPSDVGYEDQRTLGYASQGHWSDLAGSEFMWLLTFSYTIVYLVKTSCQDWANLYLIQERGVATNSVAAFTSSLEIGGIFGCLFAGALSDYMIKMGYYLNTTKSPRMIIVQVFVAATFISMNLFISIIDYSSSAGFISMIGFTVGFFMYGSISLFGTIVVETAPIHMTGTANAVIGVAANIGAIAAGMPINYIARAYNWFTAFLALNVLCLVVFVVLIAGKDIKATFLQTDGSHKRIAKKVE